MSKKIRTAPNAAGNTGSPYTVDQLSEAMILIAGGSTRKAAAAAVGIKSPAYMTKLLRGGIADAGVAVVI